MPIGTKTSRHHKVLKQSESQNLEVTKSQIKMKKPLSLQEKLKAYSALGAGFLALAPHDAEAQIVYTDIPDVPMCATASQAPNGNTNSGFAFYLDVNNDGTDDIRFSPYAFALNSFSSSPGFVFNVNTGSAAVWADAINGASLVGTTASGRAANLPCNVPLGTALPAGLSLGGSSTLGYAGFNSSYFVSSFFNFSTNNTSSRGNFNTMISSSSVTGFLGLQLGTGEYAWVQLQIETGTNQATGPNTVESQACLTILDYAYEMNSPNTILSGAGSAACTVSATISQTDSNGDGTPDILDPCSCADPLNTVGGDGIVDYFHDFITVTSGAGETWVINPGFTGILNSDGTPFATNGVGEIVLPEVSPGVYRIDFWHEAGVGFANADVGEQGQPATFVGQANSCAACAQTPTLSQWGLITLSLFLLSLGTVVIGRRRMLLNTGETVEMDDQIDTLFQRPPFYASLFQKSLLFTGLLAVIAGIGSLVFMGGITLVDVLGTAVAGPIFAYLVHLLVAFELDFRKHHIEE